MTALNTASIQIMAINMRTGGSYSYTAMNLPKNIDPAAWAVLAAHMLDNNLGSSFSHATFTPRALVEKHINSFVLGEKSICLGDYCALLEPK